MLERGEGGLAGAVQARVSTKEDVCVAMDGVGSLFRLLFLLGKGPESMYLSTRVRRIISIEGLMFTGPCKLHRCRGDAECP